MDDVKDKVKGMMKKVNKPFSSSPSGKFKGQGRVLGGTTTAPPSSSSSSSSPAAPPTNPTRTRLPHPKPSPPPSKPASSPPQPSEPPTSNGADPIPKSNPEVSNAVSTFLSTGASVEVIVKLLKNIIREPENPKFRKIRLSNPKIREAVVEVVGGVELLECVGFQLKEEAGEMWAAVVDVPSEEQVGFIREAVSLLEKGPALGFSIRRSPSAMEGGSSEDTTTLEKGPALGFSIRRSPSAVEAASSEDTTTLANSEPSAVEDMELPQKIDRQVRVFFSTPESVAAKIDLPDSFYSLSASELKREADARKKQIAESQLLVPKSYKEKKAKDARKKYKTAVIRIQFPDEVVLQGVFLPSETTTALYEFVRSSLKEPCLEFELWQPAVPRPRMIPQFPKPKERTPTLYEADLVPSALVKFKPIETDSIVFTGLSNELLECSESLANK